MLKIIGCKVEEWLIVVGVNTERWKFHVAVIRAEPFVYVNKGYKLSVAINGISDGVLVRHYCSNPGMASHIIDDMRKGDEWVFGGRGVLLADLANRSLQVQARLQLSEVKVLFKARGQEDESEPRKEEVQTLAPGTNQDWEALYGKVLELDDARVRYDIGTTKDGLKKYVDERFKNQEQQEQNDQEQQQQQQ
ncbi:hypothetical protein BCR43DRAFT_504139 [Syncephalastrum racemosum]|uniref:Uncharacterized protein n=1 Tax=Syncephalastrum racemosum TaxID=13706 RepID=A0A1X2HE22_SYNRA|nr:hypothetical protein BCR43DRAFT_504139 [Syncephalastrum racemosum]